MNTISHSSPSRDGAPATAPASPRGIVLFVLLSGGFMTVFDLFVVNVAIPALQHFPAP